VGAGSRENQISILLDHAESKELNSTTRDIQLSQLKSKDTTARVAAQRRPLE
jgi:hypothetical protein